MQKRRVLWAACALLVFAGTAGAEQLTTVAVFDMDQVLLSFYSDSDLLRDYRRAEEQYRGDVLVAETDIRRLQAQRASALSRNDSRTAARLREDILAQQEYLLALEQRWLQTQDDLLTELQEDTFFQTVYDVAGYVAEDNGYTLVMDVSRTYLGVFWFSTAIDVTEDIIQELLVRFR